MYSTFTVTGSLVKIMGFGRTLPQTFHSCTECTFSPSMSYALLNVNVPFLNDVKVVLVACHFCTVTIAITVVCTVVITCKSHISANSLIHFHVCNLYARSAGNEHSRIMQIISTNVSKLTQNGNYYFNLLCDSFHSFHFMSADFATVYHF